jgi:phosphoadenosine phosphosulfate reductase
MSAVVHSPEATAELDAFFSARGDATEIIRWAAEHVAVDQLVVACAMTSDVVLVDLVSRIIPGVEVVFLDTGYHFPETLDTLAAARRRYDVRLTVTPAPAVLSAGQDRWQTDPDGCCHERKVVPLERALAGKAAWITGVRRADSDVRTVTPFVQLDRRGLLKFNPMAAWSDEELATYAALHEVPLNPLLGVGYPSIGCWPCTRRPADGEDARAGRWSGHDKTECGLHL